MYMLICQFSCFPGSTSPGYGSYLPVSCHQILEKINFWDCLHFILEVYSPFSPNLETFLNSRVFLHNCASELWWSVLGPCLFRLNARPHRMSKATTMLYFGLNQFVFIEGKLSQNLNKWCAIFCILKPFFI